MRFIPNPHCSLILPSTTPVDTLPVPSTAELELFWTDGAEVHCSQPTLQADPWQLALLNGERAATRLERVRAGMDHEAAAEARRREKHAARVFEMKVVGVCLAGAMVLLAVLL